MPFSSKFYQVLGIVLCFSLVSFKAQALEFDFETNLQIYLEDQPFVVTPEAGPSLSITDPYLIQQLPVWQQIKVDQAWKKSRGVAEVIVAVIDTGVDLNHPDLAASLWHNTSEIPNNNQDDDHNGYIDDFLGWNFVEANNSPLPVYSLNFTEEAISHGTTISSIIASPINGKGVVGVAPGVKVMALRALSSIGTGNVADVANAIIYAVDNGADIINFSFVSPNPDPDIENALKYATQAGVLLVAAAGNDAQQKVDGHSEGDLDYRPQYPICYSQAKILGVTSLDFKGQRSSFANYGPCVDLAVPAEEVLAAHYYDPDQPGFLSKTEPALWSGTSFGSPIVSGVAALVWSLNPSLTSNEVFDILVNNSDSWSFLKTFYQTGVGQGRLNAWRATVAAQPLKTTAPDELLAQHLARRSARVGRSLRLQSDQVSPVASDSTELSDLKSQSSAAGGSQTAIKSEVSKETKKLITWLAQWTELSFDTNHQAQIIFKNRGQASWFPLTEVKQTPVSLLVWLKNSTGEIVSQQELYLPQVVATNQLAVFKWQPLVKPESGFKVEFQFRYWSNHTWENIPGGWLAKYLNL